MGTGDDRWRRQRNVASAEEEGKQKTTTGIGASLTPDYRDKEENKNRNTIM